jgi:FkbM family methyltransferase
MFHSQDKQDEFLEKYVFQGYRRGIFVDVGAWDGVCFSNTLFFERERKWNGIHIEPLEDKYAELVKNRPNSTNLNVAVSDVEGSAEFLAISGPTGMLSGLTANYDPRHLKRIEKETTELHTETKTVTVSVKRLDSIFREHDIRRVHYLSVDAEGSELRILKSIDYDFTYIDVIGFENNYPEQTRDVLAFLEQKGYVPIPFQSYDIFMIRKNSPFTPRTPPPHHPSSPS